MNQQHWNRLRLVIITSCFTYFIGLLAQPVWADEGSKGLEASTPLSNLDQPATTVDEWMQQIAQSIVQIKGVQVNPTEDGVEVILETAAGQLATPTTSIVSNALIADISNAVLALPDRDEFSQANPIAGIATISVTRLPSERVRVAITGTDAPPVAEVRAETQGLVLAVTLGEGGTTAEDDAIQTVVTGEQDTGYRAPDASTATRTDTPIQDIPASIQVVPRQVIEDRGITDVTEALENVSGIDPGPVRAQTRIRGFTAGDSFFVNGSRRGRLGFENITADNIERIEVLRGPASVLFGQGSPGGIINLVTRRPLEDPYYNLSLQVGSFEQIRPSFDLSGPVTSDETLLYRFIGSYDRARSFVEFYNSETYFFAPSLEWRISPDTRLVVDLEFIDSLFGDRTVCGIPAVRRGIADIPRSRALCETGDFGDPFGKFDIRRYNLSARLDHQFNEDWSARNTFFLRTNTLRRVELFASQFDEATGELQRNITTTDESFTNFSNNLDVVGNFTTGSIAHKLLLGFEYGIENIFRRRSVGESYTSINIFDPVYSDERFRFDSFPFASQRDQFSTTYGFYLQDQISFTDNLILVLGGRYDIYEQENINRITDISTEQTSNAFSPRVGRFINL